MGNTPSSSPLPLDVMLAIFLLLPLDSVMTCKAVSKVWKTLIEDPVFFKLYKIESTTLFLIDNILYCVVHRDDDTSYKLHRVSMKLNPDEYTLKPEICLSLCSETSSKIACVKSDDGRFLLYNLLSGDLRVIRIDARFRDLSWVWRFYGFGYDSYEQDYKILLGLYNGKRGDYVMLVYSYTKRDWKLRQGFPEVLDSLFKENEQVNVEADCSFNGHLYWIATKHSLIVGLDVHDYGYVRYAAPTICHAFGRDHGVKLSEMDGQLCCAYMDWHAVNVWVLLKYKVDSFSWRQISRRMLTASTAFFREYAIGKVYGSEDSWEIVAYMRHRMLNHSGGFMLARLCRNGGQVRLYSLRKKTPLLRKLKLRLFPRPQPPLYLSIN